MRKRTLPRHGHTSAGDLDLPLPTRKRGPTAASHKAGFYADALVGYAYFNNEMQSRYGDSSACTPVERCKQWYDGDGGAQIWRLLERQKSQQKNRHRWRRDVD